MPSLSVQSLVESFPSTMISFPLEKYLLTISPVLRQAVQLRNSLVSVSLIFSDQAMRNEQTEVPDCVVLRSGSAQSRPWTTV